MNNMAIMIIAKDRAPFLYITLSSVFRMSGIEKYPVYIFVDKLDSANARSVLDIYLAEFPIENVIFRTQRLHTRWNLMLGLKELFSMGYDRIAYFEEDHLVRSDTLDKIEKVSEVTGFFLSLSTRSPVTTGYCPLGNVINKTDFAVLYDWLRDRKFIGEQSHNSTNFYMDCNEEEDRFIYMLTNHSHDHLFQTFLDVHGLNAQYIGEQLVAHFGVLGWNYAKASQMLHNGPELADMGLALHLLFRGDKSQWLDNTITMFNDNAIPERQLITFCPAGFKYL